MKTLVSLLVLLLAICAVAANATTVTDPLQNTSYWSASNGVTAPAYQGMFGDPIGPDDGWFLQDKSPGATWEYQTTGWNKISSLSISHESWYGWYNAYGYDLAGNALAGASTTSYGGGPWVWQKTSYDLSASNYRGVKIDTDSNDWTMLVGTVQYDVTPMLGHLISADTVDALQNTSNWFDADTNTQDNAASPGNIHIAYQNIMGDTLGPDDGWEAGGSWGGGDWFSYKAAAGKSFGQIGVSYAKYPVWGAVDATLQYLDGAVWVDVTPVSASGTQGAGFSWFTNTYNLTGINTDQFRVSGDNWSTQVGTVSISLAVPEPGSILALGSGLVGLIGFGIRKRR